MVVTGRAYDIIVAKDNTDFVLRSWLSELPSKGAHSCALPRWAHACLLWWASPALQPA